MTEGAADEWRRCVAASADVTAWHPRVAGIDVEDLAAALAVAAEFPPAQRLFVLFLEAADSHRLNRQLVRCGARAAPRRAPGAADACRVPHVRVGLGVQCLSVGDAQQRNACREPVSPQIRKVAARSYPAVPPA